MVVELGGTLQHGIDRLLQERAVLTVAPACQGLVADGAHVEDVVAPPAVARGLHARLVRQPREADARGAVAGIGAAGADARGRQDALPEPGDLPHVVLVPRRAERGPEEGEPEEAAVPVARQDAHRDRPARGPALEVVERRVVDALERGIRDGHGRPRAPGTPPVGMGSSQTVPARTADSLGPRGDHGIWIVAVETVREHEHERDVSGGTPQAYPQPVPRRFNHRIRPVAQERHAAAYGADGLFNRERQHALPSRQFRVERLCIIRIGTAKKVFEHVFIRRRPGKRLPHR